MKTDVNFKASLSNDLYFIRGIAIVLVVAGHVIGYNRDYGMRQLYNSDLSVLGWLCNFINTFHMPVFFIASGIAFAIFSKKDISYVKFLRSKLEKLFIPLICWAPIYFIFQSSYKGKSFSLLDVINSAVYPYEIFWFLHALIFATFLSFLCFKVFKSQLIYLGISISLFIICIYLNNNLIYIWWHWNIFYAFGVFIAPYLYKIRLKLEMVSLPIRVLIVALLMMVMLAARELIEISNSGIDLVRLINGSLAFLLMYIMLCSATTIVLSKRATELIQSYAKYVVYLGKISMVVYLFHGYFTRTTVMFIVKVLGRIEPILYFMIVSSLGVLGPVILYQILQNKSKAFMYSIGAGK